MGADDLDPDDVAEIISESGELSVGRTRLIEMWKDAWREFVVEQKPRVINSFGQPVYRNEAGCCCPIGKVLPVFIKLSPWQNVLGIARLMKERRDVNNLFQGIRATVLVDFQACHDCGQFDRWPHQLRPDHVAQGLIAFVKKYELDIS